MPSKRLSSPHQFVPNFKGGQATSGLHPKVKYRKGGHMSTWGKGWLLDRRFRLIGLLLPGTRYDSDIAISTGVSAVRSGILTTYCRLPLDLLNKIHMYHDVERVITKTKAGYLIKWKGHSKWHCTLEPKRNLNQACLHEFQNPSKPLKHRLEAASEEVLYAIQKKLSNSRRSSGVAQVNVDQDIFR
ncbi:hypothetical protein HPB51_013490 [Rhipicephalus microplus]|uniref:Chromo domain-containing protein n=1 Tax=Rhipicephalus microplus TaxID=6941 RepID=A0A9J6EP50_RHIMP|nr:hypothetical protein HPB51_013490 [Rhipicephalus microplus]